MNHARALQEIYISRSNVLRQLGRLTLAKSDAEAALEQARQSQHQSAIARSLAALGSVLAAQGDYDTARGYLEEADRIARAIGEPAVMTTAGEQLEKLKAAEGRATTVAHSTSR
jgi:tetratricopeptide (TPR) repeat protein